MSLTPPRFRFSLRTLFVVVTVVCVWLGYQVNWIRQRHAFLARDGAYGTNIQEPAGPWGPASEVTVDPPWGLWLLGEKGFGIVVVLPEVESNAKRLFPEADVAFRPAGR